MDPYSGGPSTVRHRSLSRQSQVEQLVSGQTAAASQLEQLLLASPDPPSMPAGLNPTAPPPPLPTINVSHQSNPGQPPLQRKSYAYQNTVAPAPMAATQVSFIGHEKLLSESNFAAKRGFKNHLSLN